MSYVKPLPVGAKKSLLESSTVAPSSNGKLNDNGVVGTGIGGGGGGTTTTNGSTALSMSDASAPKLPPKPVREQVRVIFSYTAQNEDELTIKEGDIITVISKENEDVGWWKGELNGRIALFPDNFIEPFQSTAPPPTAAKPEMNNNTTNTANNNNGTVLSAVEKIGIKKPERPSSLVKPQSKSNNETVDTSPAVTPTSPASPAFGGNSVASKKLMFAHVSSQFQQQNKPPAPSVGRQTSKTNSNDSQDADAKKIKSPTSDGDPKRARSSGAFDSSSTQNSYYSTSAAIDANVS